MPPRIFAHPIFYIFLICFLILPPSQSQESSSSQGQNQMQGVASGEVVLGSGLVVGPIR